MKTKTVTISLDVGRTAPKGSQVILAWDANNQCYYPMMRSELTSLYDRKVKELEEEIAELKKNNSDFKAEMESKFVEFTKKTASISEKMINLVEALNQEGD